VSEHITKIKIAFLCAILFFLFVVGTGIARAQTAPLSDVDALRYIASHPDLIAAFGADASKGRSHYEQWGIKEGRKITFDANRYMASHADLIQAFAGDEAKAARHYIEWGYKEQRQTTFSDLDALQYIASFADLMRAFGTDVIAGIRHYVTAGYREGRKITFDALAYIASFGDLISAFGTNAISGVQHYINWGYKEGRQVIFDALGYLSRHTDLQQAFGSDTVAATRHYINWGFKEGRDYSRLGLSGTVVGLGPGLALSLRVGANTIRRSTNGSFDFGKVLLFGKEYSVEFAEIPAGQTCTISNGRGAPLADVSNVTVSCEFNQPFATEAQKLPDLEPLFQQVCGDSGIGRSLQNVIVNDFDKDGRKDLLLNIWCSPVTSGTEFTGPTPSRAFIFKQDSAGNFIEKTSDYFGSTPVDLGGVGEYYVLEDFNNDGYQDVIYSVQREDGRRINNPPTTQYVPNLALMSRGNGRYDALPWGSAAWHSQLVLAANASGNFDVIETSFSQSPQGWRWQGQWVTTLGYDWVASSGAQFLTPDAPGTASEFAVSAISGSLLGVEARKYSAGRWVKTGEFGYPAAAVQKLCCGNAAPSPAAFVSIDGKDYVDPSFGLFCELKRTPGATSEVITDFNANEVVGGYNGQLIVYGQTNLRGTDKLFSFSLDSAGHLRRNTLTIRNELTLDLEPNGISCKDLNGDGNQDILVFASPTRRARLPVIYTNDGTGSFDRVKDAALPVAPSNSSLYNYVIEDFNGDGVPDLLYFPIVGEKGKPIQILIHRGLRHLKKSDVM
jgi:hypothetical protein